MRKSILQFLLLMFATIPSFVFAGNFIPKAYKVNYVGVTSNQTMNIPMTDLFEYPAEVSKEANLDQLGITVEITPKNASTVSLYKYEYYSYVKCQYLYLWKQANAKGYAEVDVKVTYNGQEVTNTLKFNSLPLMAISKTYDILLKGTPTPTDIKVLDNTDFMVYAQKSTSTITIEQQPSMGTATIVAGSPSYVQYTPNSNATNYSFDTFKYKITTIQGDTTSATATLSIHKDSYITQVFEFMPAPGQFTNEAIAKSTSKTNIIGANGTMVSLGGFGGYIVFGFDQPIVNNPQNPYGVDFSVAGNSFVAAGGGVWTEPAAVMVMKDLNGDGIPNDGEWYELAGSDYWLSTTKKNVKMTYYNPNYNVRYTIPWTTNQGENGALLSNTFHQHSYYPDPFDFGCNKDSVSYEGNMILSSLNMSKPGYITFYKPPVFGYADCRGNSTDLTNPQNPYYKDEKGNPADGFDLNWAVDRNGNHVQLDTVHFVKVYTAGNANAGWLGEWSSEVAKAAITTPDPNYVPQDYYLNYIGITQLKVLKGKTCQYQGILFKNGVAANEGVPTWSVSNPSVGTVDNTGKFTALSNGITWLRFSQKSNIPTDSVEIVVSELESVLLELEGNTTSPDSVSMILNETIYITAQAQDNYVAANRYTYETYNWTTSNPAIGTINNGLFKATAVGRTMLHAYSATNPALSDSMLVIVKDVPSISPKNNPVVIAANKPQGSYKSTDLFTSATNSTVYLDSVASKSGKITIGIDKNILNYSFPTNRVIKDTIHFVTTSYGQKKTFDILFTCEPAVIVAEGVKLDTTKHTLKVGGSYQLGQNTIPEETTNKNVTWESSNTAIATVGNNGLITALTVGNVDIIVKTQDGNFTDTCKVMVEPFHYTDGVFFVNEDWFTHNNSTVNFLDNDGNWHYRIYQKENPGKELGATSQYGTIYGDKFYIVSKQEIDPNATTVGSRLAVCNPETMESLAEFTTIGNADGRSFLGVNEHKGYIGTSNGIWLYDMDAMTIGRQIEGSENPNTSGYGLLYYSQIGTMVQTAGKVFAVHQEKGVLVIDPEQDTIIKVIPAPKDGTQQRGFGSIVLSKDGNLWLSVANDVQGMGGAQEYMIKLNPYTLETSRITLPAGASIPNSWYAWTADGFCASAKTNKLYWKNDGGWFNSTKIYEYDIETNVAKEVIDISTFEPANNWGIYGAGFRLDPVTDDIYVSLYKEFTSKDYKVAKINPANGTVTASYPMEKRYWFPAMPVFPDKEVPVALGLSDINLAKDTVIYLGDKVSDADNMHAAIVKNVLLTANESLINAHIANDSLYITSLNTTAAAQQTTLTVKFNSNGKIVSNTISVNVAGKMFPVASVSLNEQNISIEKNETYQLTATVLPENATNKNVIWSSSNTDIATVDTNGLVTAIAKGTANIIVTTVDGGLSDTCEITTIISTASVSLNKQNMSLVEEETYQLAATVLPENATNKNVTWKSSNTTIATVENGLVTAVNEGTTNIIVVTEDGELSDTCTVTVTPKTISVTSVSLNEQTIDLVEEETFQLVATVLPENATNKNVTWESSNTAIATVDENGLVTAIAKGTATITVTTIDGEFTASCEVTVTEKTISVASVTLNKQTISIEKNEIYQLIATVLPENATNKNVTWESSNTDIATVDENGLVTAITAGIATITVTTIDGEFTANCEVTVTDVTTGIEQPEINKNRVYPTVTTGLVHIVLQGKTTELLQVVDISGKVLQTIRLQSTENTIDLSPYKSGMYLIRLGNQIVKIIKQ